MSKPSKIKFQAMKYIDQNYLDGNREIDEGKLDEYIEEFSGDVDMEKLDDVLEEAMNKYSDNPSDMDAFVAKSLHKATDLTRREAAEPRFWNYLSLVFKPEFVRHRWSECPRNRFIMRTSNGRHAFARLWWIAELTERDGDYKYTEIAFSKQEIAQSIFDNDFSHYEALLPPVLDRLDEEASDVATKYGELLNRKFAVLLEEDMDEKQLEQLSELVRIQARRMVGKDVSSKQNSLLSEYKKKGMDFLT